jgi:hypothetical protein
MTFFVNLWGGIGETWNTENRSTDCEDRREEGVVAIPGYPLDPLDAISFVTKMKRGVVHPRTMGL